MVDFSLQTGFDNRPPYCMIEDTTVCSNFFQMAAVQSITLLEQVIQ